jgi:hypothetical protein
MGTEFPRNAPRKYRQDLQKVDLFNAGIVHDRDELLRWHARFSDELSSKAEEILTGYLDRGYSIAVTLLEHPTVPQFERFAACNVWLQRGVIVERGGTQTLYLRSYMHSVADENTFANFAPTGGIRMTFPSQSIWFPLELTSVNSEPRSFVALDVFTEKAFDARLPKGLEITKRKRATFEGRQYHAARISGVLDTGQRHPDLHVKT